MAGKKIINGAYYRRLEFMGQTEGPLEQAQKLAKSTKRFAPTKILPVGKGRYEVWRQD